MYQSFHLAVTQGHGQRWNPNRNTATYTCQWGIYVIQCDVWLSIAACSLIFHPCISVPHFPVLHFQSPHINIIYTPLKSTFSGLKFCRIHYGSIFIHLAVVASQSRESVEIQTKLDLTAVQGHPRSSILVSMESPYVTSYSSLIVTIAVSATVFEIFTLKDRKLLILPTSLV